MALPWIIGGAIALGAAAVAAALNDDDKPSNNNDDDEERRRRRRAERERLERERNEKRQLMNNNVHTQMSMVHKNALAGMQDWISSDNSFYNALALSSSGSNLASLYENEIDLPAYPKLTASEQHCLHFLQGISNQPLEATSDWKKLSREIHSLTHELNNLKQSIEALQA